MAERVEFRKTAQQVMDGSDFEIDNNDVVTFRTTVLPFYCARTLTDTNTRLGSPGS